MSRYRRRRLTLLAVVLLALAGGRVLPEIRDLTLYQMTARATLVVRARALSGSTRRPSVQVLEIYKGSFPADRVTIVPHFEDHSSPTPWLRRETFVEGEESILFLQPYEDTFGRDEGPATFAVLGASHGKVEVPSEGAVALEDALRRFVLILSMGQHDRQAEALRALLREKNPYLIEAGLDECRKFRLAEPADIGDLLELTSSPRPDFRAGALDLIAQLTGEAAVTGAPQRRPDLFSRVAAAARTDAEARVRLAAVRVLASFGDRPALALLERLGREDPDQAVRYESSVAALRLRETLR
ncbi:MAG TPA: HEAT repeat domain-containing protein [Candidatus Polarisedimenticolia bacterium]|nr:HEAT repeat domain-containing protein [Candidatus Polarisedimenticolia bacterium]